MIWIMIAAAYFNGHVSGFAPIVAEFNTEAACKVALKKVKEEFRTSEGLCVPKGEATQ